MDINTKFIPEQQQINEKLNLDDLKKLQEKINKQNEVKQGLQKQLHQR